MAVVAFLGTGLMGAPMAGRLIAAGHALRVWNRSPGKAETLGDAGAKICTSVVNALEGAEFVCLCLTNADAIEHVLFDAPEALRRLGPTSIVLDFSPSGLAAARGFARRFHEQTGGGWVDAPVSGGVGGAQAGTLAIFVGGEDAPVQRAMPLLRAVGRQVTHMGRAGAGQATKLCNQVIVSAIFAATAEAVRLGETWGIATDRLPEALSGGWADTVPLQVFGARMAAPVDPGPKVSELRTMYKDILAIRAAAQGQETPLLERVQDLFRRQIDAGFASEDFPALMRNYRFSQSGDQN